MPPQPPTPPAAPAPAPAPQPAPAPAPSVFVEVPGMAASPLEGLPTTPEAVQGLRERREILRDQLTRAGNRRSELVAQLDQDIPAAARTGIQQRLDLLDARILQIESDQALTERQLSNAAPEVLAMAEEPTYYHTGVDEEAAAALAFGTFGLGVVLTLVVGRLRRRGGRRRAEAGPAMALAQDPRVDQLMQSVDAIAVEVERIGEGQRFVTQLLAGRPESSVAGSQQERR